MDIVDWMQGMALFACPLVVYILFFKESNANRRNSGHYTEAYWNFYLKKWFAYHQIKKGMVKRPVRANGLPTQAEEDLEKPQKLVEEEHVDGMSIIGVDQKGNRMQLKITFKRHRMIEVWLQVGLENGKVYQLPNHPDTVTYNNVAHSWTVGGLKLQMCEPMRKWRISFNGVLRRGYRHEWSAVDNESDKEHIRFSFIWTACSAPTDVQADWSPALRSEALAREPWRDGDWRNLTKEMGEGYEQWGTLYGTWTDADNVAKVIHLRGLRQRLWGDDMSVWQHRRVSIVGVTGHGLFFNLVAFSSRHGLTHATFGHIREPNGRELPVDSCDLSLPHLGEHPDCIPKHFTVHFRAGKTDYDVLIDVQTHLESTLYGGHPWDQEVRIKPFQCGINSKQATGIAEFWYRYSGPYPVEAPAFVAPRRLVELAPGALTLDFGDDGCQDSAVVGGKGASLATMTAFNDNQLNVPTGFCLTVAALRRQLAEKVELQEAVTKLEKISCKLIPGDLQKQCERTVALIESTEVCEAVSSAVSGRLRRLDSSSPLAVRSSGVGEDSEDLSAAGQNATMLGQHQAEVLIAIARCWASLYTFQSVQYRRQHGQEVDCGMGVVVQVMVPADTAGVMFTRHPVTGDPGQILITANYGLGESVVSALVEPDTVILTRDLNNKLSVKEMQCGSKSQKVTMTADWGVATTEVKGTETSRMCLTVEDALALGALGLKVESVFGAARDIEWAIEKGRIHLLQARPVTSLDSWSDFDLLHEFDGPIVSDTEVLTTANTGEVLPGVIAPMTSSLVVRSLDQSIAESSKSASSLTNGHLYYESGCVMSHNHLMLNVLNTMLIKLESTVSLSNKIMDLSIYGHLTTTEEIHQRGIERNGVMGFVEKNMAMLDMIQKSYVNEKLVLRGRKVSEEFEIGTNSFTTAAELYNQMHTVFLALFDLSECHSNTSAVSSFSQLVAMMVLMEGKEDITAEHQSEISTLLSSCSNVISAEIPTGLQELSQAILNTGRGEEFANVSTDNATAWLEKNSPSTAAQLRRFLAKHEHRGVKELDLMSVPWGLNPESLIKTLQATVKANRKAKKQGTSKPPMELFAHKKTGTKMVLKRLLSWCQNSVARREDTKSSLTLMVHKCRMAMRTLGRLLVEEGRIPDADLIFFFTYYELGLLIRTRDPVLLSKVNRRKRLWPQWDRLEFPEMLQGVPSTINATAVHSKAGALRVQGTSVSNGSVLGRACVVLRLDDIGILQAGDILITRSTDIAWSPYFPMLGGVVTELGGLISHGAVVAREYGLPCIVGAQSATTIFQTGDTVLLVGATGTLEKISEKENNQGVGGAES